MMFSNKISKLLFVGVICISGCSTGTLTMCENIRDININRLKSSTKNGLRETKENRNHSLTLRKEYIDQIRSGKKTVESRINTGAILNYKPGDKIRFFCSSKESVECIIKRIETFDNFKDMLRECGTENCFPKNINIYEAEQIYDAIPGYAEKSKRFGVVAIHIALA